jgi:hypothetical protein
MSDPFKMPLSMHTCAHCGIDFRIFTTSDSAQLGVELARLRAENVDLTAANVRLTEKVRVCSGALTPVSEDEKRGMERVLAILSRKFAEGGGIVGGDVADVERHNAHYRSRWMAFQECAMMLRAALHEGSEG